VAVVFKKLFRHFLNTTAKVAEQLCFSLLKVSIWVKTCHTSRLIKSGEDWFDKTVVPK